MSVGCPRELVGVDPMSVRSRFDGLDYLGYWELVWGLRSGSSGVFLESLGVSGGSLGGFSVVAVAGKKQGKTSGIPRITCPT